MDPTSQHIQYAYAERPNNSNPGTNIIYHELWLDTSGRPHRTGNTIDPRQKSITTVEEWDDSPSDPPPVYGSGILEEKRRQTDYKKPAIIGPTHLAYPRNMRAGDPRGKRARPKTAAHVSSLTLPFTASLTTSPNASREKQNRTAYETGRSGSDSESTLKKCLARSALRSQTTPRRGSGENTSTERLTSATETQRSQSTNAVCATERRRACCT